MTLTDKEYKEFLSAHLDFLFFIGLQLKIIPVKTSFKTFLDLDFKIKFQCRQEFIKDESLLDTYLQLHFDHLTDEQIKILTGFKKQITGQFIIYKCLKDYAIFIDTKNDNYYAVKALGDPFETFFEDFPVLISATILPFRNKIIYDGFFVSPIMYIGSNMTKTLNKNYKKAKEQNKIARTID